MITIKAFEFNYFQENTFVLYDDTKEAVIIDCGCLRPSEEKELSDFITENKLTVKHLLCTHLHLDHIFGNPFIYKTYGLSPGTPARCGTTPCTRQTGTGIRTTGTFPRNPGTETAGRQ